MVRFRESPIVGAPEDRVADWAGEQCEGQGITATSAAGHGGSPSMVRRRVHTATNKSGILESRTYAEPCGFGTGKLRERKEDADEENSN